MNSELLSQILNILLPAIATLLAGWFTVLGTKLKTAYEKKVNTEVKHSIVNATVMWVQQVYNSLSGAEKLEKAVLRASMLLTEKGIDISKEELEMLIESAVYGLKQGFTTPILPEAKNTDCENIEKEAE